MKKYKVLHIITSLAKGGAETSLFQLIQNSSNYEFENAVVSLTTYDYFAEKIKDAGASNVVLLNFKKHPLSSFNRLKKMAKDYDLICCWMYHANFIGYLISRRIKKRIVWNIRHSNLDKKYNKRLTLWINQYCAKHSKNVDLILYNGTKSKYVHEEFGYCKDNSGVMENGLSFDEYSGNNPTDLRKQYNIKPHVPIIASVARYHPIKDHACFLKVLGLLKKRNISFFAIMCGDGITEDNKDLLSGCLNNNLIPNNDLVFLGRRDDVNGLLSESDFYILHSASEAFPNALIQAMACKCVCVATNVGDSKIILGSDSFIVDVGDFEHISSIIESTLSLGPNKIKIIEESNRKRVLENYDIKKVVGKYFGYLKNVLERR